MIERRDRERRDREKTKNKGRHKKKTLSPYNMNISIIWEFLCCHRAINKRSLLLLRRIFDNETFQRLLRMLVFLYLTKKCDMG